MGLANGDLLGLSPGIASKADESPVVMRALRRLFERNRWL